MGAMFSPRALAHLLLPALLFLAACTGSAPQDTPTSVPPPGPTSTATATPVPTSIPTPTATSTPTVTATATPRPISTSTPTPSPTATPRPTPTATPILLPPTGVKALDGRYDLLDNTVYPPPDASKIHVTDIDGWRARVQGDAGSVAANRPVLVSCLDLPNTILTTSTSNGAFNGDLYAPPGCTLQVKHDPTGRHLLPELLQDERPHHFNAPPGTLIRNDTIPSGSADFLITGRVFNDLNAYTYDTMVPFKISGMVNTLTFSPGSELELTGQAKVLLPPGSTVPNGQANLSIVLQNIADSQGRWTGGNQKFGSVLKTPVGTPIERWETGDVPFASGTPVTLTASGSEYAGSFQFKETLPANLPEGYYRVSLALSWAGAKWATPAAGAHVIVAMYAYAPSYSFGPTLKIGAPASPKLPFMLFSDAIHNGIRGVEDPAQSFRSGQRIGDSASHVVLPRTDAAGSPRSYRISPVMPYLSYTDRGLVRPPFVALDVPSGVITTTITGPLGVTTLGPTPLLQTQNGSPTTSSGIMLDDGGGNLGDPLELVTNSPLFLYQFPTDGAYTIKVTGNVQDRSGVTWSFDGTFKVLIAESLDIEPSVLPGVPFKVGEKLPIAMQVNPSIPAQVEVEVTYVPNSDVAALIKKVYSGTANRYGYFFQGDAFTFDQPGEYSVEFRASYKAGSGDWAGVLAWSGVVAEENPDIVVHGRRGIDGGLQPTLDRYLRSDTGIPPFSGTHMNFPYHSGDVLLQTNDDAAQVRASFSDSSGTLSAFFQSHAASDTGLEGGSMAERFAAGEAPFVTKTTSGLDPSLSPEDIDLYAYYYGAASRPGERVRGGATEDNTDTYYWRFGELYGGQPGMGTEGDRPTDVKFQYAGGVIRTPQKNHYARYASLWVELPDDDAKGSRVVAPLQEPLMNIEGHDISIFSILTLGAPGTVLEVGDTFGLSGQVGPPIKSIVKIDLKAPDGATTSWEVSTNEIGWFFIQDATRTLAAPGIYTVSLSVKAGGAEGGIFDKTSYPLPVAPKDAKAPSTNLPEKGLVEGLSVTMAISGTTGTPVRSLITVPGWVMEDEEMTIDASHVLCELDAVELQEEYPLIDTELPHIQEPGLADVFVWVVATGAGADLQVQRIVLFGPYLLNL